MLLVYVGTQYFHIWTRGILVVSIRLTSSDSDVWLLHTHFAEGAFGAEA